MIAACGTHEFRVITDTSRRVRAVRHPCYVLRVGVCDVRKAGRHVHGNNLIVREMRRMLAHSAYDKEVRILPVPTSWCSGAVVQADQLVYDREGQGSRYNVSMSV